MSVLGKIHLWEDESLLICAAETLDRRRQMDGERSSTEEQEYIKEAARADGDILGSGSDGGPPAFEEKQ